MRVQAVLEVLMFERAAEWSWGVLELAVERREGMAYIAYVTEMAERKLELVAENKNGWAEMRNSSGQNTMVGRCMSRTLESS